jgi:hypothetical protein
VLATVPYSSRGLERGQIPTNSHALPIRAGVEKSLSGGIPVPVLQNLDSPNHA